jgi:hypothetical protein
MRMAGPRVRVLEEGAGPSVREEEEEKEEQEVVVVEEVEAATNPSQSWPSRNAQKSVDGHLILYRKYTR